MKRIFTQRNARFGYHFDQVWSGVARYFSEKDIWVDAYRTPPEELSTLDGALILLPSFEKSAVFEKAKIPFINLSNRLWKSPGFQVVSDDVEVGRVAGRYCLQLNAASYVFAYNSSIRLAVERGQGFRELLKKAGKTVKNLSFRHIHDPVKDLDNLPKPIAVYCVEDEVALNVLHLCKSHGMDVPGDILILGTNNDLVLCNFCTPSLSSVALPSQQIGYRGAEVLDEILQGKRKPVGEVRVRGAQVIERDSTQRDYVQRRESIIARLKTLARNNLRNPLSIEQMALRLGIHRRTLERECHRLEGKSPYTLISETRMEAAQRMLRETDMSISRIAEEVGFQEHSKFSAQFRKNLGLSPLRWRRERRWTAP